MSEHRDSSGDSIWLVLCVLLILLLAAGGGVLWFQKQQAARALQAAARNRMQAEQALAAAEAARLEALRSNAVEEPVAPAEGAAPAAINATSDPSSSAARSEPLVPELYLNQDLWRHIPSLDSAGPDDKVFTLDTRTGTVRFGDGVHGARPPDGAATVQATYRTGNGGTVTVFLPSADLHRCRLRAVQTGDGQLRLEIADPPGADAATTRPD